MQPWLRRNPAPMPQSRAMTRSRNANLPAPPWGAGLRLAMLAPISWRVPPRHYGPWERVVSLLTEGLVGRGVAVTLFATADGVVRFEKYRRRKAVSVYPDA